MIRLLARAAQRGTRTCSTDDSRRFHDAMSDGEYGDDDEDDEDDEGNEGNGSGGGDDAIAAHETANVADDVEAMDVDAPSDGHAEGGSGAQTAPALTPRQSASDWMATHDGKLALFRAWLESCHRHGHRDPLTGLLLNVEPELFDPQRPSLAAHRRHHTTFNWTGEGDARNVRVEARASNRLLKSWRFPTLTHHT